MPSYANWYGVGRVLFTLTTLPAASYSVLVALSHSTYAFSTLALLLPNGSLKNRRGSIAFLNTPAKPEAIASLALDVSSPPRTSSLSSFSTGDST